MTYTPDANEIAARQERRDHDRLDAVGLEPSIPALRPRQGYLKVWGRPADMLNGQDPLLEWSHCYVEHRPGYMIVRSFDHPEVEVVYPAPGWYMVFEPDRPSDEGE